MTDTLPHIALSVRQPWAWAIIHARPAKDIENRSRHAVTNGNMKPGRISIHASAGMTREEYEHARNSIQLLGIEIPLPHLLVRGAIIGSVDVVDIVSQHSSPWFYGVTANDRGLVLQDPRPCDPIACKGALGYFEWTPAPGELALPLPWMRAWPRQVRPAKVEIDPNIQLF